MPKVVKTITVWSNEGHPVFSERSPLKLKSGERGRVLPSNNTAVRLNASHAFEVARVFGVKSKV